MERCSAKDLEEMKGAEAAAAEGELKAAEAVAAPKVAEAIAAEEETRTAEAVAEEEMNATDFVVAYKRLPRREIDFILAHGRIPFESTIQYSDMIADSSTTREDLDREAAEHREAQESFARFQDRVRREYEATGCFKVDDDYIAQRVEKERVIHEAWSTMFDGFEEHEFGYQSDSDDLEDDMSDVNCSATDSRNVEEVALCKL